MEYAMRIYAIQTATRNINCNVIVPGVTRTEAWTKLAQKHGYTNDMEMMEGMVRKMVPMKKALAPRDIGNVVAFLCSDAGRFITGTVLPVDGGMHLVK
jgi:3-hydroxybutyrate dehydrogenase